jgi:hypothetical protein
MTAIDYLDITNDKYEELKAFILKFEDDYPDTLIEKILIIDENNCVINGKPISFSDNEE